MANKVLVGEIAGGPAELQAALDAALAGITPVASGSDVFVCIDGGLHMTRYVISYRT